MYNAKNGEWNATPPSYDCIHPCNVVVDSQDYFQDAGVRQHPKDGNLKHYMTISQEDIDVSQGPQRQQNQEGASINNTNGNSPTPFGCIFSLSQMRKRFL
jgi:hypothetical protein